MDVEFCPRLFSAPIEMIIWFLFSLLMCIMLIDFANTELSLHPQGKSHLLMVYDSFTVLLNLICYNFDEDFYVYVHQ